MRSGKTICGDYFFVAQWKSNNLYSLRGATSWEWDTFNINTVYEKKTVFTSIFIGYELINDEKYQ